MRIPSDDDRRKFDKVIDGIYVIEIEDITDYGIIKRYEIRSEGRIPPFSTLSTLRQVWYLVDILRTAYCLGHAKGYQRALKDNRSNNESVPLRKPSKVRNWEDDDTAQSWDGKDRWK